MRTNRFLLIGILLFILSFALVPGVFATWNYSSFGPEEKENLFSVSLNEFYYKPEEILPGDDEATDLHENHYNLLTNIVDHVSYGLNATSKPIVRMMLEDGAGVVYSNQNVQGGNLKHMLLDSSDVEDLMFAVEYVTATEYNAYTFSANSVTYANLDQYITVYKTQMIKGADGKWEAKRSFLGQAKVFRPPVTDLSIDVTSWVQT